MALETPMGNTKVEAFDYSNPYNNAQAQGQAQNLANALQQGQAAGNAESAAKLKALLQGNQNNADLDKLLALKKSGGIEAGDNAKLGDVNLSTTGEQKSKQMQDKNTASALKEVNMAYNQGAKGLEDTTDAVQTGLNALKSNDASSLGQLRAAMLSANGFKRFNEPEAMANAPGSVKSQIAGLMNKFGLDNPSGALNDQQRDSAVKFFNGKLDELQDKHNAIKAQALQSYQSSPYFDQTKYQDVAGSLGTPIDNRIGKIKAGFDELHSKAIPSLPTQGSAAATPGIVDSIKSGLQALLSRASGPTAQAAPQAPQQAPAAPQPAPDPINDYLSKHGINQ